MYLDNFKLFFYKYQKYFMYGFLLLFICLCFIIIYVSLNSDVKTVEPEVIALSDNEEKEEIIEAAVETIFIDIKGEVDNPGVYEMQLGDRVIDAVQIAGGFTDKATTDNVNLSKKLKDETVIIIPSYLKDYENVTIKNDYEIDINDDIVQFDENESDEKIESSSSLVNINTASVVELMSLDGIGESKAKAIIEYRDTNGDFENILDIMNVSGIGESIYEKIKDYITV